MRISTRLMFSAGIVAVTTLFVYCSSPTRAESQALTSTQIETIRANCQTVKNTLQQLHASDALLRVNRGQVYEALSARLMDSFNARLANNRLDDKATLAVASSYQTSLNTFRADYKLYEEKLASTIKIDCQKDPESFHWALEDARAKRKVVHDDVVKLHRYIDDFRSSVTDFLLNYERKAQS